MSFILQTWLPWFMRRYRTGKCHIILKISRNLKVYLSSHRWETARVACGSFCSRCRKSSSAQLDLTCVSEIYLSCANIPVPIGTLKKVAFWDFLALLTPTAQSNARRLWIYHLILYVRHIDPTCSRLVKKSEHWNGQLCTKLWKFNQKIFKTTMLGKSSRKEFSLSNKFEWFVY